MGEVTVQSDNVGLTSYQLTSLSFRVNRPSHSWHTAFSKFDLEIKGQGHGWGNNSKSQYGSNILSTHIPFVPSQLAFPFLKYSIFKIWPWKSRVKVKWPWCCTTTGLDNSFEWYKSIQRFQSYGFRKVWPKCCLIWQVFGQWANPCGANEQITMTVHNYRSRQVHETLNGVNPSSGFRDMRSAKSGPNLWQIWQVFGPWASPYEANGQMSMTVHNYRPRQFHRTSNGENPSSGYRDMGSASLAAARPTARPPGPWRQYPSSPEGWGVKRCDGQMDRQTDGRMDWTIHRAA